MFRLSICSVTLFTHFESIFLNKYEVQSKISKKSPSSILNLADDSSPVYIQWVTETIGNLVNWLMRIEIDSVTLSVTTAYGYFANRLKETSGGLAGD